MSDKLVRVSYVGSVKGELQDTRRKLDRFEKGIIVSSIAR